MKINTSLELVRYIRHHLAGSEWQDVKAVEDFVKMQQSKLRELATAVVSAQHPESFRDSVKNLKEYLLS